VTLMMSLQALATHLEGDATLEVDGNVLRQFEDELRVENPKAFRLVPDEAYPERGARELRYYGPGGVLTVRRRR